MDLKTLFLSIWYSVFLIIPLLWLAKQWRKVSQFIHEFNKLPGPPTIPILGNTLDFCFMKTEDLFNTIQEICKKFPRFARIWMVHLHIAVVLQPEDIEVLLGSSKHIQKSKYYSMGLEDWMGTGLLTSGGSKWHKHRKLLTPTFHFKILELFVPIFHENSHILISKLQEQLGSPKIDILWYISLHSLDVICETAMGTKINAQRNSTSKYIDAIQVMHDILYRRALSPWLYPEYIFKLSPTGRLQKKCLKIIHGFTQEVIQQRKEYLKKIKFERDSEQKNIQRRLAFLDLLIEASEDGTVLTDKEIQEEVDTFMFEGHDTVSTAISWALFLLGTNNEIQEKVMEELNSIFGTDDRTPSMDDLSNMKYMERCIKEALRLYPSVPFFIRSVEEDILLDGYKIPAGTQLAINTYSTHRNAKYFPNPEEFNPDNFLSERVQGRHPYVYIPFSAGPRNCIGQRFALLEMKSTISAVLRKFRVEAAQKREEVKLLTAVVLKPKDGINIRLYPRNNT